MITTTDRIRTMTDEEYAEFVKKYGGANIRVAVNKNYKGISRNEIIEKLYLNGVSQSIISTVLGISQPAISKIISAHNKL